MGIESEKGNSVEKSSESDAEKKEGGIEKESIPQSKREGEHADFSDKKEQIESSIDDTEGLSALGVDLESKRSETEQKIEEFEQGLGGLSEESRQQIWENNVGRFEDSKKQTEERLGELNEQKAELIKHRLLENLGISFSAKSKEKMPFSIEEQLATAQELGLKELQVDLRSRSDIESTKEALLEFRRKSPETNTSLHGDTPKIDESTLELKNVDKLRQEIELATETGSDIYTVHPPSISHELFSQLPEEQQAKIIDSYATFYAESIRRAIDSGKLLVIAIENMPAKGEAGSWGQSPEEINLLVHKTMETLESRYGVEPKDSERFIGVTLDINHALATTGWNEREAVMREWIDVLSEKIKAFHVYSPSSPGAEFDQKLGQFIKLYKEYGLDTPIYLESKHASEATKNVFLSGQQNSEIQMKEVPEEQTKVETEVFTAKEKETNELLEAIKLIYQQAGDIKRSNPDTAEQKGQVRLLIDSNEMLAKYFDETDKELLGEKALEAGQISTDVIVDNLKQIVPKIRKRIDENFEE